VEVAIPLVRLLLLWRRLVITLVGLVGWLAMARVRVVRRFTVVRVRLVRLVRRLVIVGVRIVRGLLGGLPVAVTRRVRRLVVAVARRLRGRFSVRVARLLRRLLWRLRRQPVPHSRDSLHMTPNSVTDPAARGGKNRCSRPHARAAIDPDVAPP
jgi:hypothetical protein